MTTRLLSYGTIAIGIALAAIVRWTSQAPVVQGMTESALREYTGVYQWGPDAFIYLQIWNEFAGTNQLVAFDESGEVRTLYPLGRDRFFSGPGAAVSTTIESHVDVERDPTGEIRSITWRRNSAPPRTARRVDIERHEAVRFVNADVALAGTLIAPRRAGKLPAVIVVHGSGAETREAMLPFARFLVRRGMVVLTYDKRLQRFSPEYFATIVDWLAKRIHTSNR